MTGLYFYPAVKNRFIFLSSGEKPVHISIQRCKTGSYFCPAVKGRFVQPDILLSSTRLDLLIGLLLIESKPRNVASIPVNGISKVFLFRYGHRTDVLSISYRHWLSVQFLDVWIERHAWLDIQSWVKHDLVIECQSVYHYTPLHLG